MKRRHLLEAWNQTKDRIPSYGKLPKPFQIAMRGAFYSGAIALYDLISETEPNKSERLADELAEEIHLLIPRELTNAADAHARAAERPV